MKAICSALMVTVSLFVVGGVNGQAKKADDGAMLVGVWELVKGEAPPGSTVEFTKDGKAKMHAQINGKNFDAEGTYKLEGKKMTSKITFQGQEHEDISTIDTLTDSKFITIDDKGKKDEYKKKTK